MDKLTYELNGLCHQNNEGSFVTQDNRKRMLRLFSRQLKHLGFRNMSVKSLRTTHVHKLLELWKTQHSYTTHKPISNATIKNRMSVLRWWAKKINKQNIIPRDNKALCIDNRRRIPKQSRAFNLRQAQLTPLPHYLQLSLRLQQEFGLRREEAAKFVPTQAIKIDHIVIARAWAKGGRERNIPITTAEQIQLLDELRQWKQSKSLIPTHYDYRHYLMHREAQLKSANIRKTHGLRHYYAQRRYAVLTNGLEPKIVSGISPHQLSKENQQLDYMARAVISQELGHGRIEVTRIYLG